LTKYDMKKARELESYCHANRCITGILANEIPCWIYGNVTLFQLDKPEDHIRYAGYMYSQHVCRVYESGNFYENGSSEQYKQFHERYHTMIATAKQVLSEKTATNVGLFSCPKCKSKDVDTEQKQTRSADEPMTIFCACTRCQTRWTIK
jgi:DNA-directed RNA polymerase subunit M/transcription elongation factor TFIIS